MNRSVPVVLGVLLLVIILPTQAFAVPSNSTSFFDLIDTQFPFCTFTSYPDGGLRANNPCSENTDPSQFLVSAGSGSLLLGSDIAPDNPNSSTQIGKIDWLFKAQTPTDGQVSLRLCSTDELGASGCTTLLATSTNSVDMNTFTKNFTLYTFDIPNYIPDPNQGLWIQEVPTYNEPLYNTQYLTTPFHHGMYQSLGGSVSGAIPEMIDPIFGIANGGKIIGSYTMMNLYEALPSSNTIPVLTLNGTTPDIEVVSGTYTELGATCTDVEDGNINANVVIGGDTVNISVVGMYTVTYDCADSFPESASQITRLVAVVDTVMPMLEINGDSVVNLTTNFDTYTELSSMCMDGVDGMIDGNVVIGGDTVNTSIAGVYTVTYDCDDSSLNSATQITRTVNVINDTEAPMVILVGATPKNLNQFDVYSELGSMCFDDIEGSIDGNVIIGGDTVNTSIVGTYNITYDCDDFASNSASQLVRVVNVLDVTAPILTLTGSTPVTINHPNGYSELSATCLDAVDGQIDGSVVIGGDIVDVNTVGVYNVTYDCDDTATNSANQLVRVVNIVDITAPILTLNGGTPVVKDQHGTSYSEVGALCFDVYDGQINGNVVIGGDTVDVNTVGTYNVTYDCQDANTNNAIQLTRTVSVVDAIMPLISPIELEPITLLLNISFIPMDYVVCNDVEDGIIVAGGSFSIDGGVTIDTSVRSTQTQDYICTDNGSNIELQTIEFIIKKESGAGSSSFTSSSAGIDSGSKISPPSLSDIPQVTQETTSIPTLSLTGDNTGSSSGGSISDLFSNLFSNRLDSSTGEVIKESLTNQVLNSFTPDPSQTGQPSQSGINIINSISDSFKSQPSGSPATSDRPSPIADFFSNLFANIFG